MHQLNSRIKVIVGVDVEVKMACMLIESCDRGNSKCAQALNYVNT